MSKYKFIYCNRCKDFYLNYSIDFGSKKLHCPNLKCMTDNIKIFEVNSFSEMSQIERTYKINKLSKNGRF